MSAIKCAIMNISIDDHPPRATKLTLHTHSLYDYYAISANEGAWRSPHSSSTRAQRRRSHGWRKQTSVVIEMNRKKNGLFCHGITRNHTLLLIGQVECSIIHFPSLWSSQSLKCVLAASPPGMISIPIFSRRIEIAISLQCIVHVCWRRRWRSSMWYDNDNAIVTLHTAYKRM